MPPKQGEPEEKDDEEEEPKNDEEEEPKKEEAQECVCASHSLLSDSHWRSPARRLFCIHLSTSASCCCRGCSMPRASTVTSHAVLWKQAAEI